ncbi:MAG: PrgI family protein [Candidatus Dojkabacteria bacterium]|jgi:hypothetical protein
MRQHAIPQNVLDVEFKLFTKFTLKEFAYLAVGVGFGGLMIYLVVSNIIPALLGVPVCIVSSTIGIILGLVPINDQDADKFIQSYITAINNPTQRTWLNKEMKEERIKPLVKPTEDGTLIHKDQKKKKKKIIGVGLDKTEKIKENIEQVKDEMDILETKTEEKVQQLDPSKLLITDENISNYQFSTKGMDNLPGNINCWLCTQDFKPIPNVIAYLRDSENKIIYANKTGPNGYFLTNQVWEEGIYNLTFQHPQYTFPSVEIIMKNVNNRLPIKINAL